MADDRLKSAVTLLCEKASKVFISKRIGKIIGDLFDQDVCYFDEKFIGRIESFEKHLNVNVVFFISRRLSFLWLFLLFKGLRKKYEYYIFPSIDDPRWIVPASFLNFDGMVRPSTFKAKLAIKIFKLLLRFNLGQLIFPYRICIYKSCDRTSRCDNIVTQIASGLSKNYLGRVLYLGSFGPLQKTTIEIFNGGKVACYAKVASNDRTKHALFCENNALLYINSLNLKETLVPQLIEYSSIKAHSLMVLVQSPLVGKDILSYSGVVSNSLSELYIKTAKNCSQKYDFYLRNLLNELECRNVDSLNLIHVKSLFLANEVIGKIIKLKNDVPHILVYSHGDFTRWNIREKDGKLCVFDWEEAKFRTIGYDIFHFFLIEYVLVDKNFNVDSYYENIFKLIDSNEALLGGVFYNKPETLRLSLSLYLIDIISVYLWHQNLHREENYPKKDNIDMILKFSCSLLELLKGDSLE